MVGLLVMAIAPSSQAIAAAQPKLELTDAQVENIVRRAYQYVALYNVINKSALDATNPTSTGGFNKMRVNTALLDHNIKAIARPNNDTLYIICMLDLRKDPIVFDIPSFKSTYVSLMTSAYDHYVDVPLSMTKGDFAKPQKVLLYSARTQGYKKGQKIKGVDRYFEMSGDFVIAVFRVMPHANDPAKFKQIVAQMKSLKMLTLSEYLGGKAKPVGDVKFPAFGKTDADVFAGNFLEVMQFVFNHTTFDPKNKMDQAVLAAFKPLGVLPGKKYDPAKAADIDGQRFRKASAKVFKQYMAMMADSANILKLIDSLAMPKPKASLEAQLTLSVVGPIGLPAMEALYPPVTTADGKPMNARYDYVIRMTKEQLPPAKAFWSLTLYDLKNGFFIPNDRKKYSVGLNTGMKLNAQGGIDIYVAAKKPQGVPEENWLPINRKDENMDIILRIYAPDLKKFKAWTPPKAQKLPAKK